MSTQTFTPNPQVIASYDREIKELHRLLHSETNPEMRKAIKNEISEVQAEAGLYSMGINF